MICALVLLIDLFSYTLTSSLLSFLDIFNPLLAYAV